LDACRWDEQNALLVESHERVIKDLTEEAEAKLAVEVLAAQSLRQEKGVLLKEASEVRWSCGSALPLPARHCHVAMFVLPVVLPLCKKKRLCANNIAEQARRA
jgi:hypothetical protein